MTLLLLTLTVLWGLTMLMVLSLCRLAKRGDEAQSVAPQQLGVRRRQRPADSEPCTERRRAVHR